MLQTLQADGASKGRMVPEGYTCNNVLASYVHLHFASCPEAARALVERCRRVDIQALSQAGPLLLGVNYTYRDSDTPLIPLRKACPHSICMRQPFSTDWRFSICRYQCPPISPAVHSAAGLCLLLPEDLLGQQRWSQAEVSPSLRAVAAAEAAAPPLLAPMHPPSEGPFSVAMRHLTSLQAAAAAEAAAGPPPADVRELGSPPAWGSVPAHHLHLPDSAGLPNSLSAPDLALVASRQGQLRGRPSPSLRDDLALGYTSAGCQVGTGTAVLAGSPKQEPAAKDRAPLGPGAGAVFNSKHSGPDRVPP